MDMAWNQYVYFGFTLTVYHVCLLPQQIQFVTLVVICLDGGSSDLTGNRKDNNENTRGQTGNTRSGYGIREAIIGIGVGQTGEDSKYVVWLDGGTGIILYILTPGSVARDRQGYWLAGLRLDEATLGTSGNRAIHKYNHVYLFQKYLPELLLLWLINWVQPLEWCLDNGATVKWLLSYVGNSG
jgi:hypothetical protein